MVTSTEFGVEVLSSTTNNHHDFPVRNTGKYVSVVIQNKGGVSIIRKMKDVELIEIGPAEKDVKSGDIARRLIQYTDPEFGYWIYKTYEAKFEFVEDVLGIGNKNFPV